eukprot:g4113.t1
MEAAAAAAAAAIVIQRRIRGVHGRQLFEQELDRALLEEEQYGYAVEIQRRWRGLRGRELFEAELDHELRREEEDQQQRQRQRRASSSDSIRSEAPPSPRSGPAAGGGPSRRRLSGAGGMDGPGTQFAAEMVDDATLSHALAVPTEKERAVSAAQRVQAQWRGVRARAAAADRLEREFGAVLETDGGMELPPAMHGRLLRYDGAGEAWGQRDVSLEYMHTPSGAAAVHLIERLPDHSSESVDLADVTTVRTFLSDDTADEFAVEVADGDGGVSRMMRFRADTVAQASKWGHALLLGVDVAQRAELLRLGAVVAANKAEALEKAESLAKAEATTKAEAAAKAEATARAEAAARAEATEKAEAAAAQRDADEHRHKREVAAAEAATALAVAEAEAGARREVAEQQAQPEAVDERARREALDSEVRATEGHEQHEVETKATAEAPASAAVGLKDGLEISLRKAKVGRLVAFYAVFEPQKGQADAERDAELFSDAVELNRHLLAMYGADLHCVHPSSFAERLRLFYREHNPEKEEHEILPILQYYEGSEDELNEALAKEYNGATLHD